MAWLKFFFCFLLLHSGVRSEVWEHCFSSSSEINQNFEIPEGRTLRKQNGQLLPLASRRRTLSAVVKARRLPCLKIINSSGYGLHAGGFYFKLLPTIGAHANGGALCNMNELGIERYETVTEAKDNSDQSQQYAHNVKLHSIKSSLFLQNI